MCACVWFVHVCGVFMCVVCACMCVCMCVYICGVCMCLSVYACGVCVHMFVCASVCVCVCMCVCVHVRWAGSCDHSDVMLKDPESLASEIADSLQEAFMKLKFSRVEISSKPHLTGVEVTPPVEVQITPPTELDEKEDQDQIDGMCVWGGGMVCLYVCVCV